MKEMTQEEIEQFLTCARVGRLGLMISGTPHVIPVGYAYACGEISFHACSTGSKMQALKQNPTVCFEVDETLSDVSMFKSVILFGTAKILENKEEMKPHLQRLIDKYRVPQAFNDYMNRSGRDREKEMNAVKICIIKPTKITGRKFTR